MFLHSFKYTLKYLLRERAMVFWALIFPFLLAILFKMAFGNLSTQGKFERIDIGVKESLLADENFKNFLDQMEDEDYFKVHKANDKNILDQNDKVKVYVESLDKVYANKSGISQTIVETILNAYLQKSEMVKRVMAKNPKADLVKVLEVDDFINDKSRKNMDPINTFFYTLVGMTTIYGYMWGLFVIYQYEANLSVNAKRNTISPLRKSRALSASILASWLINFAITLIFIGYLKKVIGVDFGDRMGLLVLLSALSSLTGIVFGIFIGVSNKKSIEFKINLGIAISMLMSFLAGMMMSDMKVIIEEKIPILNKLNPVALVTDAIYALYYYEETGRFYQNMVYLGLVTLALILGAMYFMRGKEYESL